MHVTIVTIFPDIFPGPLGESLLGKAQTSGLLKLDVVDLRDFTHDPHRTVDDAPFGGGGGMVLKPDPFFEAVDALRRPETLVIMLGPQGRRLEHSLVVELSRERHLLFLCGRYEGIDQRVSDGLVDLELSIGDYVLSGGELAAMVVVDAVARTIPGVVGNFRSVECDSFYEPLLDHPHYTRPREVRGMTVPEVLLSGDHERIARWRRKQRLLATARKRRDLLDRRCLNVEDQAILSSLVRAGEVEM